MYEILSIGRSPDEAKAKGMIAMILLTEEYVSADMAIKIINMIGGISVTEIKE